MGNTASNTSQSSRSPIPSRRIDSSVNGRRQAPSHSPSPHPHQPHRSLRNKKKSLELPDLAPLSLTPAASYHNSGNSSPLSPYRRPPGTTSPIPIPIPAFNNGTMNNASNTGTSPRGRQLNLKGTANRDIDKGNYSAEPLFDHPPSTHIPVHHHHRPRGSPYFRNAHLQYSSTSVSSRGQSAQPRMQELYAESEIDASVQPDPSAFVQETVHSTIPLALQKAEEEIAKSEDVDLAGENGQLMKRPDQSHEDTKEPVSVKITWNGGGKNVILVRAGDNNWKGRLPMEPDDPSSDKSWSTWVPLMPGTHHIRFIVDEQSRVAEDLPTAVDDEGSLANYVAVPISGLTPPSAASAVPAAPVGRPNPHAHSFWSTTSSTHGSVTDVSSTADPNGMHARWTDEIPPELVAAAREEESYLAYTAGPEYDQAPYHHVPTPNIPPAPGLPRHLDKLILNAKAGQSTAGTRGRERDRERERERERERRRPGRSLLGMTSTVARDLQEDRASEQEAPAIPITTASGTDVTSVHLAAPAHTRLGLDGTGSSDDASVLPVPSHVVLHHLSTSAIRNGVLAVANTTRYRTKYLTTIYYKPT